MLSWVSVKKALPKEGQEVLVYASRGDAKRAGDVYRARYCNGAWEPTNKSQSPRLIITHWAYLNEVTV